MTKYKIRSKDRVTIFVTREIRYDSATEQALVVLPWESIDDAQRFARAVARLNSDQRARYGDT